MGGGGGGLTIFYFSKKRTVEDVSPDEYKILWKIKINVLKTAPIAGFTPHVSRVVQSVTRHYQNVDIKRRGCERRITPQKVMTHSMS